jgi:hypothetical protein
LKQLSLMLTKEVEIRTTGTIKEKAMNENYNRMFNLVIDEGRKRRNKYNNPAAMAQSTRDKERNAAAVADEEGSQPLGGVAANGDAAENTPPATGRRDQRKTIKARLGRFIGGMKDKFSAAYKEKINPTVPARREGDPPEPKEGDPGYESPAAKASRKAGEAITGNLRANRIAGRLQNTIRTPRKNAISSNVLR